MRRALLAFLLLGCSSSSESAPADQDTGVLGDAADETVAEAAIDSGIPTPTPADIQFEAKNPLPSGEQILFNDWNALPNTLATMKPDGTGASTVFEVYRVWSMGVANKGDKIAFSCGDPKQKQHYGLEIGDSIQHTWMYDVASQSIEPIAIGNLNDECHAFSNDGAHLYVCRRYDFTETATDAGVSGENKGWRIARIDLATKAATFLTPDVKQQYALSPQPTADEKELWYSLLTIAGGTQKTRIVKQPLPDPTGTPTDVKLDAARPALSPDGTRYAYNAANTTDKSAIHVAKLDGSGDVKVTTAAGTNVRWSPDGTKLVYLVYDSAASCQHVEVVAADGSDVAAPKRIRDCSKTKEFITSLAWISR